MARFPTLLLTAFLLLALVPHASATSATTITVSNLRYDILPLGTTKGAHFAVFLTVAGGATSTVTIAVSQAGTGAGSVGASQTLAGHLGPGVYALDIYQTGFGVATQVCASAIGADANGAPIESADGTCSGITTIAGQAL